MQRDLLIVLLLQQVVSAQDSLNKPRLKLFDCVLSLGVTQYADRTISMDYISKFSGQHPVQNESEGYAPYSSNAQFRNATDFGVLASLKVRSGKPAFTDRIQMRIYLHGLQTIFFDYSLGKQETYTKDTLYYTDPSIPPLLIEIGRASC